MLFDVIPICALSFVVDYIKIRKPNLLVMTIASFIVYSFEGMLLYYINTENASSYNIFMLPTVLLLFVLVKSISIQLKYSYIIRKSSTIIYCIHPLVITILGLFIKNMNSLVHFILVSIFAFMIGLGLVALSKNKKFRFLKYIM